MREVLRDAWAPGWYGYDPASEMAEAWGPHESQGLAESHPSLDATPGVEVRTFFVMRDDRALQRRDHSTAVCERRTLERDRARFTVASMSEDAEAGRALRGLVDQINRMRKSPCPTMEFGVSISELPLALESELAELALEQPHTDGASDEIGDVLALAVHIAVAHETDLTESLNMSAAKIRSRMDIVDAGGTWADAKADEQHPPEFGFTIGVEVNYDRALAEAAADGSPMRKSGKGDGGRDPDYLGGWVWSRHDDALTRAAALSTETGQAYAVYLVQLPMRWGLCTYMGDDGWPHLLVPAVITGKDAT